MARGHGLPAGRGARPRRSAKFFFTYILYIFREGVDKWGKEVYLYYCRKSGGQNHHDKAVNQQRHRRRKETTGTLSIQMLRSRRRDLPLLRMRMISEDSQLAQGAGGYLDNEPVEAIKIPETFPPMREEITPAKGNVRGKI